MKKLIFVFTVLLSLVTFANAPNCNSVEEPLKFLSFNIQIQTSVVEVGPWKIRKQLIADLIRQHEYHVIGMQEVLFPMLKDLSKLLPEYGSISVGRENGRQAGEHATIFYRKDRLELLQSETFWLSPTPQVPGSKGWDASAPRIVTWALFWDRMKNQRFYFFNTHFDHWGKKARLKSANLLASESLRLGQDLPRVILGDLNATADTPEYQTLLKASGLQDAMTIGPHQGPDWTYSFFGFRKVKLDYILVPSEAKICEHSILPEDPGASHSRSDHLPISVRLIFQR